MEPDGTNGMKWVTVVLLAALVGLQYNLWVDKGGWRDMWSLEKQLAAQQLGNQQLQERNQSLEAEIVDLQEGEEAIAEIARDDLGYIKTGEVYYRMVAKTATP